jgi:hypothetical protein
MGQPMPLLKREFHRRAKGPVMNDEDWWRLVFDTDAKRLYVEHEWAHTDVRKGSSADSGTAEFEISAFLNEPSHGAAQRQLLRLLTNLFEVGRDA